MRACISKTSRMFLKVTDRTDKSPFRRHGFSSENASDVLTKPTRGLRWSFQRDNVQRRPRERPRVPTGFVALSGSVLRRPRGAPRWAVGDRSVACRHPTFRLPCTKPSTYARPLPSILVTWWQIERCFRVVDNARRDRRNSRPRQELDAVVARELQGPRQAGDRIRTDDIHVGNV